jgi:hypothetical protein
MINSRSAMKEKLAVMVARVGAPSKGKHLDLQVRDFMTR